MRSVTEYTSPTRFNSTVESCRRRRCVRYSQLVGDSLDQSEQICQQLSQVASCRRCERTRRQSSWADCELCTHHRRRRDSTRQLRRIGVGGVYCTLVDILKQNLVESFTPLLCFFSSLTGSETRAASFTQYRRRYTSGSADAVQVS